MNGLIYALSMFLIGGGVFFFLAGGVGMLRFPDAFSRLHATTKADNLGLGLLILGLLFHVGSFALGVKLVAIWLLMAQSSATVCHLIARVALRSGMEPWRRT